MRLVLLLLFFSLTFSSLYSQIVPAGLGKTNVASSLAFGIKQELDTIKDLGWLSSSYIALGRVSGSKSRNPFKNQGIFIVEQEFYNRFHKNWEHSIALSYRRQEQYDLEKLVENEEPKFKNEFRLYGRFSYVLKMERFEFTPTFRQEFIKYYNPDFTDFKESFRIRSRVRLKFSFSLTENNTHKLIFYSEQLFSTSQNVVDNKFDQFKYKDSRFSLYYSCSPKQTPFTFNVGYMSNLIGVESPFTGQYIAVDVIWKNPFRK